MTTPARHSDEQLRHSQINLSRMVKNLEMMLADENQHPMSQTNQQAFIKATSTQTTVRHAQQLLREVEQQEAQSKDLPLQQMRKKLEQMENTLLNDQTSSYGKPTRPKSILASMKPPRVLPPPPSNVEAPPSMPVPEAELLPAEESILSVHSIPSAQAPQQAGLPSPPAYEDARPSPVVGTSSSHGSLPKQPAFLTTSLQTQEDLSLQLSQMATQLKMNALHFADSLAKEKGLVEDAQEKLEVNYTVMKKERTRLRDFSGKSSSTTWMVLGAVGTVFLGWVLMFIVIRLT